MFPCGRCQVCPFVDRTNTFCDAKGENTYTIKGLINCTTERVIYMLTCPCPKIYVGKTKRQLKVRIGEHIRDIRNEEKEEEKRKKPGYIEKFHDSPVARHFLQFHGGKSDGLKVKGFYTLNLPARRGDHDKILNQKEKWWIYTLKSLAPLGINTELSMQSFL